MSLAPSLFIVKAILLLDQDGNRLLVKYYDKNLFSSSKEEIEFERNVFSKTHKSDGEILLLNGLSIVYKSNVDLFFYVVGSVDENELILASVLNCVYESFSMFMKKNVQKSALLENLHCAYLVLDEICDGGVLMEVDPNQIMKNIQFKDGGGSDVPLGEKTVSDLMKMAKEQVKNSVFK